ncbi:Gp15 family bacteriophage protein [Anoxybacillus sp. UARK-01]|uniref:Gp15 family bacteriophage protein n=1 Tax=Anoxybacillus sp. UARK-01 TaxID=1895648 RepID=UPI0013747578|nr:Gp15 family bacteriophage protein [Anoxybacillus sp. UARK-01]
MSGFRLTSTFDDCFEYKGKTIHLDLSFDNVLRVFELFSDEMFLVVEKIEVALEMLVLEFELVKDVDLEEKKALLFFILKEFLDIDLEGRSEVAEKKIFDFEQDAGLIYASFLHAYGIDLFEQHGKLHWKKFLQLLQHLDDKSKFKEVVNIRKMPMPKPDKYNTEYRKQIAVMKRIYALDQPENEEQMQAKINKVFDTLASTFKRAGEISDSRWPHRNRYTDQSK